MITIGMRSRVVTSYSPLTFFGESNVKITVPLIVCLGEKIDKDLDKQLIFMIKACCCLPGIISVYW